MLTADPLDIPDYLRRPLKKESVVTKTIDVMEPQTALAPVQPQSTAITPMDMLERAVSSGASIEVLTKLMDLQDRWEKNQARKAFDEAMAAAKADIPVIFKNRTVDFTSQKGRTNYRHEDLAEIAKTVDPILARHGLSYRFRATSEVGAPITVTCVVSHRMGHSEEITLSAGRDESGNKNSIQAVGSSITYLQRYTLKAALGLAASNDDDGASANKGNPITDEQFREIGKLIAETKSNVDLFCKAMKVECLTDIPASRFDEAISRLNAKAAKLAGAKT